MKYTYGANQLLLRALFLAHWGWDKKNVLQLYHTTITLQVS